MIKKPNELNFNNKKISMIIAGVAGIGKTTLALSSPKPLLIDLDKGISRVEAKYRCDIDEVEKAVTTAIPHSSGWTATPEACASLMSSEGLHITNWKLCQRVYATMLLDSEHGTKLGALLPCTFSISETRDGHLTISRLNTTLLGFILGGDAGKIYRQNITNEQEAFIEAIRHINFKENVSASTKKEEET